MASTRDDDGLFGATKLRGLAAACVCVVAVGCVEEYDLERSDPERGTLGQELHDIWLKDTRRSGAQEADERTQLLEEREEEFVGSVDRAVPEGHVHELDEFLHSSLELVEDGYVPALSRRLPGLFEEAADDQELMLSLQYRPPYRPGQYLGAGQRGGLAADVVDYDPLPELISYIGQTMRDNDGLEADGEVGVGTTSSYSELLRGLADLADRQRPDEGSDQLATTLRDVLTAPDNRYHLYDEPNQHRYIALFDDRGVPKVVDDDGELPAPFVDNDGDGRPDIDDHGRFVLDDGQTLEIAPFGVDEIDHDELRRDIFGRVEYDTNRRAFEYVDIGDTALPYLVDKTADMIEDDVFYDLVMVHRDLFGPTEVLEDDRGTYQGYPDDHPIVDIVDALVSSFTFEGLPEAMGVTSRYISAETDEIATLAYTFGDVGQEIADFEEADIYPNQTLVHDIVEVLREIAADPELWADVIDALRDPVVEETGEAMATLLEYSDREVVPVEHREDVEDGVTGDYEQCFQDCRIGDEIGTVDRMECIRDCPSQELFSEPMEHGKAESPDNRSVMQRVFHLLRDTSGVQYDLEIEELEAPLPGLEPDILPPIMTLPGAAEAFIRAVAGNLHIADYITDDFSDSPLGTLVEFLAEDGDDMVASLLSVASEMFGMQLDEEPTPDQITRMFNQTSIEADFEEDDVYVKVADPECHDGFVMANHHADGLFAAEASGLIDAIHPLAKAFSDHEREDLFAQLFVVVHDHYASRDDLYLDADGNPSEMKASNIVSAEPVLQDIAEDGDLFEAIRRLALSTEGMSDEEGVELDERLRQLVYELVRDDNYEAYSEPEVLELNDGRVVEDVNRLEVILDRAGQLSDRHEDDEELQQRLSDATSQFFDAFLAAEQIDDGDYVFKEDAVVALITKTLEHVGRRAGEMEERGELQPWLTEDVPDGFANFYSSRGFYGGTRLMRHLKADDEGREMLEGLPTYIADDQQRTDHLAMGLYGLIVTGYDLDAHVPFWRIVLEGMDPDRDREFGPHRDMPTGSIVAIMLRQLPEIDESGHGLELLARGSRGSGEYQPAWPTLIDMLISYFSYRPVSEEPMTRQSWAAVLERIGDWIGDDQQGLERFYELVEYRGNMELEEYGE